MRLTDSFARSAPPTWVWPALVALALLVFAGVALGGERVLRGQTVGADATCGGKRATVVGTAHADRLTGTHRRDVIFAGGGDDVVQGRGGADVICGGEGDDRGSGGAGTDLVDGGRGDDRLVGERGNDVLRGNAGNDRLGGGPGSDRCVGGPGRDVLQSCESGDGRKTSALPPTPTPAPAPAPAPTPTPTPTPGPGPAPVDQPPVAVNDAATAAEDSGAQDVPVLANDNDPDGGPKSIGSTTQPANGEVVVTGGGTGLTYQPDPGYCNDHPGSGTDDFTYTLAPGGSSATVAVRVACVGDPPLVMTSAGSTGYTENGLAVAIDSSVTVVDLDSAFLMGATVQITGSLQPGDALEFVDGGGITGSYDAGTGTLTLSGTALVSDYQSALQAVTFRHVGDGPAATRTISFSAGDGTAMSAAATKGIAVTPINDAPSVASEGTLSYIEGDGAVAVDAALAVSDPDSAQLSGATVQISSNFAPLEDELAFVDQAGITGSYSRPTGTLTLSGTASVAAYRAALRSVTYENSSSNPTAATRTVSFQATDTSSAASNFATRDISVAAANDAPVLSTTASALSYTEGDPSTPVDPGLLVSDADDANLEGTTVRISSGLQSGDDLVFANQFGISGVYNTATGVLTLTGTASLANYQTALRSIGFRSSNVAPVGSKMVEFKANDGDTDSNAATRQIAVTPVNSAPQVAAGGTLSYTENDPATAVHPGLTASEPDGDGMSGGSASITANYQAGQDFLNWTDNNLADNITLDAINSTQQTIVLTGMDTAASYQAALRAVTYGNNSDSPSTATRTVTFSAADVFGDAGSGTRTIAVAAVVDPPDAVNDSATVLEDTSATTIPVLTNDTDVDAGPKTISSATDPVNGTVVVTGGSPGAHTGLTYQPEPNYCNDPPGTTPDSFSYTLNGGDSAVVSMTVTCVNDAPVADDETFNGDDSAHGNTTMIVNDPDDGAPNPSQPKTTVSGDILAGDTDSDGPGPLTVTSGTFATNDGGAVTIQSDGDFIFNPAASTSCTDTSDFFDYTVEDSGSPEQTDTGRVTIAIAGCVWYVSNNASGNSGTSSQPFDTLAQAETASANNHTVFVFDGDNTTTGYATGYALNPGERLIGEHEGLVVDPDQGDALTADTLRPANPSAYPTLTATNEDVVELDDGNEVQGFGIDPQGTGGGIAGGAGDTAGGTIDDVNVVDNGIAGTQAGLELNGTTGTFNITNLVVSNQATGVLLDNAGTTDFGSTTITSNGGPGLSATGTNMGTSTFDAITVTGSSSGGVSMSGTTGATTFGDGNAVDLALTTSSSPTAAFSLSNAGTLVVEAAGVDNVAASGGPAINVTGTAGAALAFDDVDSTGSTTDGINLADLGAGTFSATSGDITGATGIAFDLHGGSGAVTYPGNLGNGTGHTAEITGRSGGAVTLGGAIADTNDGGGGISLLGNTGGSTTFSNASKVLNTTSAPAVSFLSSDGHTLTFSGGGLDIDTTTGAGLSATSSDTLVVEGANNTIDTTTGRALSLTNTDIGAADLTFQSISANGANSGIVLNNTGSSGGLTVTGSGTVAHSGGTIQNTTSHAISLTSTRDVDLNRLRVMGANRAAVKGTGVTNFSHTNSTLSDVGDARVSDEDAAFAFNSVGANNVNGLLTITGNTVTNPYGGGVQVRNASGTISQANVSSNIFESTADPATSTQDGVSFHIEGTPTTAAALTQATISGNTILNFPSGSGVELVGEQITSTDGPRATLGVPDSTTNRVVVSDNEIRGNAVNKMGVFGVAARVSGMADGNVRIASNGTADVPMQDILGEGIGVDASGTAHADFVIENNFVAPGSVLGSVGIGADANRSEVGGTVVATPDVNATISGNTVSNTSGAGIKVQHFDSNGNLRAKITGNTVGAPAQPNPGIAVENGSSTDPAFNPTLCAQITGNPATGSGPDGSGDTFPGIDLIERSSGDATYRLQIHGLTPDPATAAQTETFLAGENPASSLGGGFYAGKRASVSQGNTFEACTITF